MLKKIRLTHSKWNKYKAELKEKSRFKHFVVDFLETIIVALALALLIRKFIIQTSLVPTGSMIPTLNIRDRLFVNKFIYRFSDPKRGDIVVFLSPHDDGKDYVKRCIGVPGDSIQLIKGKVFINNKQLILAGITVQEDYSFTDPVNVPEGHYFMLGDNRGNSQDSRYWGFVPKEDVLGEALFTFWPISRMRLLL
jgi:signal peptidase I